MGAAAPIQALLRKAPLHMTGRVTRPGQGGVYWVQTDADSLPVQCAASCLMTPHVDDEVLLYGPVQDVVYVLAILRQSRPGLTRIETAGEIEIVSSAGGISLHAAREVSVSSEGAIRHDASRWQARADEAQCTFTSLDYLGREARVALDQANVVVRICAFVAERLSQFAHSVTRLTRDTEQVRAGHLDLQAQHTLRLHAEHSLLTATRLVKVDADQIHMG